MHLNNKIVEQSLQNDFSRQFVSANFQSKSRLRNESRMILKRFDIKMFLNFKKFPKKIAYNHWTLMIIWWNEYSQLSTIFKIRIRTKTEKRMPTTFMMRKTSPKSYMKCMKWIKSFNHFASVFQVYNYINVFMKSIKSNAWLYILYIYCGMCDNYSITVELFWFRVYAHNKQRDNQFPHFADFNIDTISK